MEETSLPADGHESMCDCIKELQYCILKGAKTFYQHNLLSDTTFPCTIDGESQVSIKTNVRHRIGNLHKQFKNNAVIDESYFLMNYNYICW